RFLDSGALYRVLALAAGRHGVALDDEPTLSGLALRLDVRFVGGDADHEPAVLLDGADVSREIRTETCGNNASRISAMGEVRAALLARQRDFRIPPGLVADGRDMGTVVFSSARAKVFLDAGTGERARRRYNQLKEKGIDASLEGLVKKIEERDIRDRGRSVAPLKPADDAVIIDTTELSIEAVVELVMDVLRSAYRADL
ncbi:MAG: (d)CMP kinase, partial [Gammaproteobacteria bacterium]|nr:(d)CMP kinase [Gammaproteobacteria bacterium]